MSPFQKHCDTYCGHIWSRKVYGKIYKSCASQELGEIIHLSLGIKH